MSVTSRRLVPVLIVLSVGLSGLILAQARVLPPWKGFGFVADEPPEAVAALLHVAGLATPDDESEVHLPLVAMEGKAIRGKHGKLLKLAGVGFLPAVQLEGGDAMKYKAKAPKLMPGSEKSTARGSLFPKLGLGKTESKDMSLVQILAKGDTKLFMQTDPGKYEKLDGRKLAGERFEKNKAKSPPFGSPFALAGKIKDGDKNGMFKLPVLEYRRFAKKLQHAKMTSAAARSRRRCRGRSA